MKKDYIQDLLANLLARRKKKLEEDKIMDRNEKKLSLVERNAYEQMMKRVESNSSMFHLTSLFLKIFLIVTVFTIASIYFYGNGLINFKELFEPVFRLTLQLFPFVVILDVIFFFIGAFAESYNKIKVKKRLLLK